MWDGIRGRVIIGLMPRTHAQQKALAMQWKAAAPRLRKARHADIRHENSVKAMEAINSLVCQAVKSTPARRTSGFVQMYTILARKFNS